MIYSPTLSRPKVRVDLWGDGHFGTSRGTLPGGSKKFHDGLDIEVFYGEQLFSPISGRLVKIDYPYASDLSWRGVEIHGDKLIVEVWYMEPKVSIVGSMVTAGITKIGKAQAISQKYGDHPEKGRMKDHVHMRVKLKGFNYLTEGKMDHRTIIVDPEPFIVGG